MKNIILIFILFSSGGLYAQNLVPNPSFEEFSECPTSHAQFESRVLNWESWQESPDYFNTCNNELSEIVGIPSNIIGYQWPITGVAYAAIYTTTNNVTNGREYIAAQLIEPLESGENYYIFFHATWFDGGEEIAICAANHIGLRFFKDPSYNNIDNPFYPDNFSHLEYNEMLIDSSNWVKIEGWFTADDNYNWLAIGNFYDDNNTDTSMFNDEDICFAMYYIENVCVAKTQGECDYLLNAKNEHNELNFHIYPNPASDNISIRSSVNNSIQEIRITDISGKTIKTFDFQNTGIINMNVESIKNGIYFIQIKYNNNLFNYKIIIQ